MKKTKIIIPALAAVCVSAAASVTGTVAWFSASRSAAVNVNKIAVVNPEGSLNCSTTSIANTACTGSTVEMKDNGSKKVFRLRDASVACTKGNTTPTVYKAKAVDPDTHKGTGYETVASSYVYSTTDAIAYAAAWKMTFSMSGNSADKYDVTFNNTTSGLSEISGEDEIYTAYRIAFLTSTEFWIWAPNQNGTITYVNGTTATSTATYSTEVIKADTVFGTIGTKDNKVGNATSLDVYCYMWFEGTDENCVESNLEAGSEISAKAVLNFDSPLNSGK